MVDPPDDLNDLLGPPPPAGGDTPGLRDAILRRTESRLRRVRWVRRGRQVAAVTAVFALGLAAGRWLVPERERVVTVREVETVAVPVVVMVPGTAPAAEPPSPAPAVALTAARAELEAEQADDAAAAADWYRRAGDLYLSGPADYANAARCYRLFLARAGDRGLSPEPNDSWLLTSIKNAAFKEKVHATTSDG